MISEITLEILTWQFITFVILAGIAFICSKIYGDEKNDF